MHVRIFKASFANIHSHAYYWEVKKLIFSHIHTHTYAYIYTLLLRVGKGNESLNYAVALI